MTQVAVVSILLIFGTLYYSRAHEIIEEESTYQIVTLSSGAEAEDVMQIAILRAKFDRDLYSGIYRIQDLALTSDYSSFEHNPYHGNPAYENVPSPMVEQAGVVKMSCVCIGCKNLDSSEFPECSGSFCEYKSVGSHRNLPPRFLMPMPAVEEVSSVFYSLLFQDGHTEPGLERVDKTFTAIKVLRTKNNLTGEWEHYVPEGLNFEDCKFRFELGRTSSTGRELTYPTNGGLKSMGGVEATHFTPRLPSCNYQHMSSLLYRLRQLYEQMKDPTDVPHFLSASREVAKIKASATWINCEDHIDGVVVKKQRHLVLPDDKICRQEIGSYAWLIDPCCNWKAGVCMEREDHPLVDIPTELNKHTLKKFGETEEMEQNLIFAVARNTLDQESCLQDTAWSKASINPFREMLENMVNRCEIELGFHSSPKECSEDSDCRTSCDMETNQCVVPYDQRMQYTLECWSETMNRETLDALRRLLGEITENPIQPIEKMLEDVASKSECVGETAYKFDPDDIQSCLDDEICQVYNFDGPDDDDDVDIILNDTEVIDDDVDEEDSEDDVDIILNDTEVIDDNVTDANRTYIECSSVNDLVNNTNPVSLQNLLEATVARIRSKATADILQCKYSLLYENYQSLACEKNIHKPEECFQYENLWPTVKEVQIEEGSEIQLRECSVLIEHGRGLLVEQLLAVDPKTMTKALAEIHQREAEETGDIQVIPAILAKSQTPFDSIYTSYLMKNSEIDYRIASSPEFGGVTKKERNEILAALPEYAKTHELDPYAVVVNAKGSIVGQVVGTSVMLKTLEGDTPNSKLCLRLFPGVPIDKKSFPVADFAFFNPSQNTFVPMNLEDVETRRDGEELCAVVTLKKEGFGYAPIFRYQDWKSVDPCVYDTCMVCNGHNTTCSGCDQVPFSGKVYDECEVCGGDNSECRDCKGVINGPAKRDRCGTCEGDGSTCICCPGMTNPPFCDVEDKCYNVRCLNGGVCSNNTGICSCTLGFTGKNCEIKDCNSNGFYSPKDDMCTCDRGWSGSDCTTCGFPETKGDKFICAPFGMDGEYILTTLPENLADQVVKHNGVAANESEVRDLRQITIIMRNEYHYGPIWPGSTGYDGYIRDCACKKTPIKEDERDPHNIKELGKMIPVDSESKHQVPVMFTKSELYSMSERHHLSEDSKEAIRQRNRRSGLYHPKDVEPKTYDDISERCLDVVESRNTEIQAHESYFRQALHSRAAQAQNCQQSVSKQEYGAPFWVLAAYAIVATVIIIAMVVLAIARTFELPLVNGVKKRFDEFTLNSEGRISRKNSNRVKVGGRNNQNIRKSKRKNKKSKKMT